MFKKFAVIGFAILMAICFASCDSGGGGSSISGVPVVYNLVYSNVPHATGNVTDYNFGDDIYISVRVKDGDKDVNNVHFVIKQGGTELLNECYSTAQMPAQDASLPDFPFTLVFPGTLNLSYSVKDAAGNESNTLSFTINVH